MVGPSVSFSLLAMTRWFRVRGSASRVTCHVVFNVAAVATLPVMTWEDQMTVPRLGLGR